MSFEIEQLGRDVVRRYIAKIGGLIVADYKATDLYNFQIYTAANNTNSTAVVRTSNADIIGYAHCYKLDDETWTEIIKRDLAINPTQLFFVDFSRGKVFYGWICDLSKSTRLDQLFFPLRFNDDVYFHQAQFHFAFDIELGDMKKFESLCTLKTFCHEPLSADDTKTAARIIKDLHRKKLAASQADFDKIIDSLLE